MIKMILCCMFRQTLENSNMKKEISAGISFILKEKQTVQRIKWYPKVKNEHRLLGCVECSTNGDSLGERRIFVPPSFPLTLTHDLFFFFFFMEVLF
jgi:hypothetical protein